MSKPLNIVVKESADELKLLLHQKYKHPDYYTRIKMLILIKEGKVVSKRALAEELGISDKSVHVWRTKYHTEGLTAFLKYKYRGKKGIITEEVREALRIQINREKGFSSYGEIISWLKSNYSIVTEHQALWKYIPRHFGRILKK